MGHTVSAVCVLDTGVFCELLAVPGKSQNPREYRGRLKTLIEGCESILLPLAVIIETGNHIGQVDNGSARYELAKQFVNYVRQAIDGKAPFSICGSPSTQDIGRWLNDFPNWATRAGSGLADLSIKMEWHRQCQANRRRRVYIWSKDAHLAGCDQTGR